MSIVNKVDEEYPTQISVITWIGPFKHLFNSINHFLVLKTSVCFKTDRHILSKRLSCINQILFLSHNSKTCLCTKCKFHYEHTGWNCMWNNHNTFLIIYLLASYKKYKLIKKKMSVYQLNCYFPFLINY